ncbi:MAG: hypothetical protein KDA69_01945 [Planctomycetaceae bacterium]|nr:hypothetical protein [Planctomycetaceae bacterium]MCA9043048.1 hypothetical protein [Planctomycetaceae bacterium]
MSFRRSKSDVRDTRKWHEFFSQNESLIEAATLSLSIVADERHWMYFLEHGTLYPEDDFFCVDDLNESQMGALIELTARYFESFNCPYFDPVAFGHTRYFVMLRRRLGQPET